MEKAQKGSIRKIVIVCVLSAHRNSGFRSVWSVPHPSWALLLPQLEAGRPAAQDYHSPSRIKSEEIIRYHGLVTYLVKFVVDHEKTQWNEGEGSDDSQRQQPVHGLLVRTVDSNASWRSHWVRQSGGQLAEDFSSLALAFLGEVAEKLVWDSRGPHGSGDSSADCTAHLHGSQEHRSGCCDFLVAGGCLDAQLDGHVNQTATDADHDLCAEDLEVRGSFSSTHEHEG